MFVSRFERSLVSRSVILPRPTVYVTNVRFRYYVYVMIVKQTVFDLTTLNLRIELIFVRDLCIQTETICSNI